MRERSLNGCCRRRKVAHPHRLTFKLRILGMSVEATERSGRRFDGTLDVGHGASPAVARFIAMEVRTES